MISLLYMYLLCTGFIKQQQQIISSKIRKLSERQSKIEEMKHNHTMEISQLQANYEQLRKTLQKMKL